jgi:MFS family permease
MKFSLRSIQAKFYSYAFFDDFILIYPFYTLLFADVGISPAQIALLLMVWSGTAFLLEIPSGAIADKFNRRNVLVIAMLLRATAFGVWLFFPNFWGFLAGFILWGVESALSSGTQEALVYDELAKEKKTSLYSKVVGRMESLRLVATVLAGLLAAALADMGYTFILACSIIAIGLSAGSLLLLPRSKKVESTEETQYLSYLIGGVKEAMQKPILVVILVFITITAFGGSLDEYFSLFLREKGLDNATVALWVAIISAFGIAGSLVAHRLENSKIRLEVLLLIWAGLLLGGSLLGGLAAPIMVGLFVMVYYIAKIVFTAHLQHAVSDRTRATTTSVGGFLEELAALACFAIIGFVSDSGSYSFSFSLLAVALLVITLAFWLFTRFMTKRHALEKLGL